MDSITKRNHKAKSKLDHAINFILLDQDTTNRIELRKTIKIGVVIVIRYGEPPPSLAVAKGSAHTHVIISPSLLLVKKVVMMDSHTSSVRGPPACG